MKFTYLEKGITKLWRRRDGKVVTIGIINQGDKRLKIRKDFDNKLHEILRLLFLDNGEYLITENKK